MSRKMNHPTLAELVPAVGHKPPTPPKRNLDDLILFRYGFTFLDAGNCDIEGCGTECTARSLGHALQKIAALEPADAVAVRVWLIGKF